MGAIPDRHSTNSSHTSHQKPRLGLLETNLTKLEKLNSGAIKLDLDIVGTLQSKRQNAEGNVELVGKMLCYEDEKKKTQCEIRGTASIEIPTVEGKRTISYSFTETDSANTMWKELFGFYPDEKQVPFGLWVKDGSSYVQGWEPLFALCILWHLGFL